MSFCKQDIGLKHRLWLGLMAIASLCLVIQVWLGMATPAMATGVYEMPALSIEEPMWVLDEADVLSRINRSNLTKALAELAKSTENQVHLVTIHRLDYGETIESFSQELFETWFPTPEEQANQTLLVLDTLTNNAAIQVGDQSQNLLTDSIASSVAQETLMKPLREGNRYNQALMDASDRLVAVLSGNPDPGPPVTEDAVQTEGTFATPDDTKGSNATVWVIGLLIAATVIPMATYYFYQAFQ